MQLVLRTHRPWFARLFDALTDAWRPRQRHTCFREVDLRTLADIGIDPSEISSIQAEAGGMAPLTRLRIVAHGHHV
jgi:uncharacterized protein YjiS (DUF1127 family)